MQNYHPYKLYTLTVEHTLVTGSQSAQSDISYYEIKILKASNYA